ncbi:hypothetical protein ACFQ11_34960, partial [Actinomadura sediminis]
LGAALGARVVLDSDDPAGRTDGAGRPSAQASGQASGGAAGAGNGQGTGAATTGPSGPAGGRTPGPDGRPPDELLLKQPTADYQNLNFSETDRSCLPALGPENSSLQRQMQTSAPRTPHGGETVEIGMRHKWETPPGYYVAAEVRVPRGAQIGNAVSGAARSKPQRLTGSDWVYLTYPTDFEWAGSGGAYPLVPGTWTVIWLHVHPNGDAYYIGCDGFTVG